jgi:hypothetical protein
LKVNVKGHQEVHGGHCEHYNFKTNLYKHGRKDFGDIGKAPKYIYIYIEALNAPKRTSWVLRKIKFLVSEK